MTMAHAQASAQGKRAPDATPILELRGLEKRYPGTHALKPVDLAFKGAREAGEAERLSNPRARSAKLRAAVRTDAPAWGRFNGKAAA